MNRSLRKIATGLILLSSFAFANAGAAAQSASPVARLDPTRISATYFVIERYPIKREKACLSREMVLYALGDKPKTFQIVATCQEKADDADSWDSHGKLDVSGNGKVRLSWIWPFTKPYWFLAIAPDYTWALAGTPNHKSLWILSRTSVLAPGVLSAIEAQASAQGYNTAKLIKIPQQQ